PRPSQNTTPPAGGRGGRPFLGALRARCFAWPREVTLTSLMARPEGSPEPLGLCPRLGDCSHSTPSRACGRRRSPFSFREAAMTPRRTKTFRLRPQSAEPLRVQNPHAAGIDVHAAQHWAAVPPEARPPPPADQPPNLPPHVRKFGACTADLEALADWLAACGITTVALESTGVYWIPLFELLERRGFQVFLVDPRQTRQVTGRPKTDVLDCQWIQRLHSYGLLAASFRPEDQVVVLRGYLRQRQMLIRYATPHVP